MNAERAPHKPQLRRTLLILLGLLMVLALLALAWVIVVTVINVAGWVREPCTMPGYAVGHVWTEKDGQWFAGEPIHLSPEEACALERTREAQSTQQRSE